jgi:hypothetical protein
MFRTFLINRFTSASFTGTKAAFTNVGCRFIATSEKKGERLLFSKEELDAIFKPELAKNLVEKKEQKE